MASGPTPYVADGTDVPLIVGDGGGGFLPDVLPDDDIGWVTYDGDGAWLGGINGIGIGTLNFRIANWIDTEPLKIVQMQFTYDPGPIGLSPFIDEIIPFDPLGIDSVTNVGVVDGPIAGDPLGRDGLAEVRVGAGPGDKELITLKAIAALADANVILYDALVNECI